MESSITLYNKAIEEGNKDRQQVLSALIMESIEEAVVTDIFHTLPTKTILNLIKESNIKDLSLIDTAVEKFCIHKPDCNTLYQICF